MKQPARDEWIQAIERVQPFDHIVQTYFLCQLHFSPDDIDTRGKRKYILENRVPSIFSNNNNDCIGASIIDSESTNSSSTVDNTFHSESLVQNISNTDESSNEPISSPSTIYDR